MIKIEDDWEKISESIKLAVTLISDFGYNRDLLTSTNAVIPIAYYFYKKGNPHELISSSQLKGDRDIIRRWLVASLLKQAFGGTPDAVLGPIRQIIKNKFSGFPMNEIVENFRGKTKSILINDDDIENLFFYKYGHPLTFSLLALLYPTLDFKNKFHQDHIFPKSFFSYKKLIAKRFDRYKCDFCLEYFDTVANLQLIEGTPNLEKADKD